MRIGIDARMYGPSQGGIGRYIEQLIKQLQKIDHKNQYILFLRKENFEECKITNPNFKKVLADIHWYSLKEQLCFSGIIKEEKIDLMHFPHWNVPLLYRGKFILTIHDLIMYHFPRTEASTHGPLVYWLKDRLHRLVLSSAVHHAGQIIAPCNFTKQDIIKTLKINPEKITVTYLAPFTSTEKQNSTETQKTYNFPFALYVGAGYPHKNLPALLRAWKIVETTDPELHLILAGRKNYFYEQLLCSSEYNTCNNVHFIESPDDNTLESLYHQAALFVYPSLYEGFGLPPLEAMTHNLPVTAANSSCLPEILQDSAAYFDPRDPMNIATVISRVYSDKNEQTKLKNSAQKILNLYSWEHTAAETLTLYQKSG